ncbi:MAG: hypothetical protein PHI49_06650 [Halothiobacillaceae bacterium]|nr:hypothetical protein [Halothiobacillaceae bacterium]
MNMNATLEIGLDALGAGEAHTPGEVLEKLDQAIHERPAHAAEIALVALGIITQALEMPPESRAVLACFVRGGMEALNEAHQAACRRVAA